MMAPANQSASPPKRASTLVPGVKRLATEAAARLGPLLAGENAGP